MSTKIFPILMMAVLGFVSVSSRAAPQPSSPEEIRELAYTEKRWIGLRRQGIDRCPTVDGWATGSLLDLATLEFQNDSLSSLPRRVEISTADLRRLQRLGLDRYCIYTAVAGTEKFLKPSGLVEAERDRMALSTTSAGGLPADSLGQMIWQPLAEQFRKQTSFATSSPSLRLKQEQPTVRLSFIDSQPDGERVLSPPSTIDSQHGFTLAHLANSLVCPASGPCAAMIVARRALRYQSFDPQQVPQEVGTTRSGHLGLVSDLAVAILAEVLKWREAGTPRHLILNLSLGWDGELFKDLDAHSVSQLEPSVQAVYKALRFARQSGVLVVAAAGNDQGRESAWPLLPAAWELRRPTLFHFPFGCKRVYAVGGVDSQGLSLPNTRKGGQPRRVAYADHSVTQAGADPTAMYTGTSVSAAVASSIAAVVWHLRPELNPAEVMNLITQSGDVLDLRADFYAWREPGLPSKLVAAPFAKRLSFCSAVEQACGPGGKRCSALEPFSECPPWVPKPAELAEILVTLPGDRSSAQQSFANTSNTSIGTLDEVTSQRWVIPQPDEIPCPGCTLVPKPPPASALTVPTEPQYELVLEISPTWEAAAQQPPVTIKKATLSIDCLAQREKYELAQNQFTPNKVHRISGLARGKSLQGCTAKLLFELSTDQGPKLVLNPVVIDSRTSVSR